MAFQAKIDYAGLATTFATGLSIRDDSNGKTADTYTPQGQDGSYIALEVYGEDESPSNSYGVKKAGLTVAADTLILGKVSTQDSKKYMLESVAIGTTAGSAPTVSANSQLVENDAADGCQYKVPAFTVTSKQHAQILFNAFTLSEGCTLTACNANISCTVGKDKVAGVIISSDIGSGYIEVTGTVLQTGSTVPTVTAATGWTITAPLACSNPETAYPSYTFTVRQNLTKTTAA